MYFTCIAVQPVIHVLPNEPYVRPNPDDVQGEPNMYDFMDDCSMVKTDSPFRSIFTRYYESEVPHAAYLEGLRVAVLEYDLDKALSIMKPMSNKSLYAALAIPILRVCVGDFYVAVNDMYSFWEREPDLKVAEGYGTNIIKHVAQLGPASSGCFFQSWVYMYVPHCAAPGHRCKTCLLYAFAKIVRGMV